MKPWTYEEESKLLELKEDGYQYLQIARMMDRTPDSLRKKYFLLVHSDYNAIRKVEKDFETVAGLFLMQMMVKGE